MNLKDSQAVSHVSTFSLKKKIKSFPYSYGVYLMYSQKSEIIYIGKAKSIAQRLKSYFSNQISGKNTFLMKKVYDIDYISTQSEYEAFILENTLIKQHQPKYNINLKDDKTYPFICISHEDFPRVFITRNLFINKAEYFGPYPEVALLKLYIQFIHKYYKIRLCKEIPLRKRKHPCLYYYTGRCEAPCISLINSHDYQKKIHSIRKILNGDTHSIEKKLDKNLKLCQKELQFEKAKEYYDIMHLLKNIKEEKIYYHKEEELRDYINYQVEDNKIIFSILKVNGKMIVKQKCHSYIVVEEEEAFIEFIKQYYLYNTVPYRIVLIKKINTQNLEKFFQSQNIFVQFSFIENELDESFMKIALNNIRLYFNKRIYGRLSKVDDLLLSMRESLFLKNIPYHIEGCDIAHIGGKETSSAMVHFQHGKADKKKYRWFMIRSVAGINDIECIKETIARRCARIINEQEEIPQLFLIDGGKAQLNAAYAIIQAFQLESKTDLIALAKRDEWIYTVNQKTAIVLAKSDPVLHLLQAVRDEAHRFSRKLNKKRYMHRILSK